MASLSANARARTILRYSPSTTSSPLSLPGSSAVRASSSQADSASEEHVGELLVSGLLRSDDTGHYLS